MQMTELYQERRCRALTNYNNYLNYCDCMSEIWESEQYEYWREMISKLVGAVSLKAIIYSSAVLLPGLIFMIGQQVVSSFTVCMARRFVSATGL